MRRVATYAALAVMLAMPPAVSADTIVYDNSVNFLGFFINGREAEWGDGATLAGTGRMVTRISLMIHSNSDDVTSDLTVRLFEGGDDEFNPPGAMLWESELFQQMTILDGSNLYDFDVPSVTVPDSVTWTLELQNADPPGAALGSRVLDPPVVGSSGDFFWRRNPDGTWSRFWHGLAPSFGARIEAVPEPGTLTLFALCAAAMPWHRRPGSRSPSSETYKNGDEACPDH